MTGFALRLHGHVHLMQAEPENSMAQKTRWRCSMRPRNRNSCARSEPMVVVLEFYPELLVVHPQIAVAAARHGLRRDLHDLLRHDANVRFAAAVIAEAIEAEAIVQITQENDVMLEHDVRAPAAAASATATPATAATTAAAAKTTAAAAAAVSAQTAAAAATAEAGMASATAAMARAGSMGRPRPGACALSAAMCGPCSLAGTMAFAHIRAAAARPVARLGTGPIAAGTDSIAGFVAGVDHLLTATAAKIALTSAIAGLPMIDPRLPSITAPGDRMRGPIPRRRDVDVVAAAAPVDVAAPITS
jgi:hypothetical protein